MVLSSAADRLSLLLAACYLAAALHGLGAADIVGDDEAREAGIVQDVVAGHWLLPRFNDDLLPDKPILYHWLAAVPCALTGFSETAVRLPSALAGAALVAWTARFGAALLGPAAGIVAGGLLATTPALFAFVRLARPDALLVLLLAAALGHAFRWWQDRQQRDATVALILLGAATAAKGPVAPALFACTLCCFLLWQRDLRRLRGLCTVPGVLAFLVFGLGWYVVALGGWGEHFVREHLIGRYLGNLAGGLVQGGRYSARSLGYHLGFYPRHLLAVALPWTPFVALALHRAWRSGGLRDPRLRFLLCWAAAPVVVFTPAEYKLRYYLLPSLPALALLTAPAVIALWREPARRLGARGLGALAAGMGLAAGGAAWALTLRTPLLALSDRETVAAFLSVVPGGTRGGALALGSTTGVLVVTLALRRWRTLLALVVAGSVAWLVAGAPALETALSRRDSLKGFARAVAPRYPPPALVRFVREPIRGVVVYMGRPVPTIPAREVTDPGMAVIATEAVYQRLSMAGVVGPPLLVAAGRTGTLARGRVVLAERLAVP
jgi:4-amino-4-deoxy-L-arabinose transferase-like glycosyltransferase